MTTYTQQEVLLEAHQISKTYEAEGKTPRGGPPPLVLDTIELQINVGEFVAILGPSGSGKSTLLRILAGLLQPSSGQVLFKGLPQSGANPHLAIVFQSFALFPWLTVLQNVELGLQAQDLPRTQRLKRTLAAIDTIGLDGYEDAYPKELSGGMRQRVGFARALVVEPELLFMDEPFSALDVLTAANLRKELMGLWSTHGIPTRAIVMVTHNITGQLPRASTSPQLLPRASIGDITGLMELVHAQGDRADLYQLGRTLQLEVDDLLPLVEATGLLALSDMQEGDLVLTPQGQHFAEADVLQEKQVFREQALAHVPMLGQIVHALETTPGHILPEEYFLSTLEAQLGEEWAQQQLDILVDWGRYAELFSYQEERGIFRLEDPDALEAA
jgi:NitT/TauT family transport system ATP-binding protein